MPYRKAPKVMGKMNLTFITKYHKKPIIQSNKLAYLAGIVDGEGHIKVEKWGTVRLVIGMTDYNTIKWIEDNFGGVMDKPRALKSKKTFYVWRAGDPFETMKVMLMIYPFMITKKQTVIKALGLLMERLKIAQEFTALDMFKSIPIKGDTIAVP